MDHSHVRSRQFVAQLADRFEVGQALDVSHRPSHFHHHHVGARGLRGTADAALDLVGDVGDDLYGMAEVVAHALSGDHVAVHATGGEVVRLLEILAEEPLVVADVEVRLQTVPRHEHLAVLVGVHRPRVHVDVGVDLLEGHLHPARLEQASQRRRKHTLPQAGDHATGDEHVLGHGFPL